MILPIETRSARHAMQIRLLRQFCWLVAAAGAGLTVRETAVGSPVSAALLTILAGLTVVSWSHLKPGLLPVQGLVVFGGLVLLVTRAGLDMGGAAGSALCFSFIPGLLTTLVLGPGVGWGVCGLMCLCMAWLAATTPLPAEYDLLRFVDEVAMTLFATGLAHALERTLHAYEAAIDQRRLALSQLRDVRLAVAQQIYDKLEPLAERLIRTLPGGATSQASARGAAQFDATLDELMATLSEAKVLAHSTDVTHLELGDPDTAIRCRAMSAWLRLGAGFMAFFVLRNAWVGAPFGPALFSFVLCFVWDAWLQRPSSRRHLELTALGIGAFATAPMALHISAYGAGPDAPPLVVTPAIVLFTALLSQGPATWVVVALNGLSLVWVGAGTTLTLSQSRLLGDLVLCFLVVVLALRSVLKLRRGYATALLEQAAQITEALRQHRRLAGTLFHDVSNQLHILAMGIDLGELDVRRAGAVASRIQRLISLSKEFLLNTSLESLTDLRACTLSQAAPLLREVFGARLSAKGLRLIEGPGMELRFVAHPELLAESVLGNLLSNALKFSPHGGAITLSADRVGDLVRLCVRDGGAGFPPDALSHLPEEGPLPSRIGTDGEAGQGFGLQLVNEHVTRMGGRLELSNHPEGGAECVVWLPAA